LKNQKINLIIIIAIFVIFFTNFHIGFFTYKNTVKAMDNKQYTVYEDKSGYKVLETSKHSFIIKAVPKNVYKNY